MRFSRLLAVSLLSVLGITACGGGSDNKNENNDNKSPDDPPSTLPFGLTQRPQNLSCVAPSRPVQEVSAELERVFPALQFELPVSLQQAPNDASRWFVLEQISGLIKQFENRADTTQTSVFLDLSDRVYNDDYESGLLGMAFHPAFPDKPYVYLSYTRQGAPLVSYISRFRSADGGLTLDASSEQVLLTLDQPSIVHQGGQLSFGPDGYLYIGFGDGGHAGFLDANASVDPFGHGQNTETLFSSLLRIDVDNGQPYAIPADNPFVAGGGRPEIFAWGLRNPWRWSFDRATGRLWLGDVGEFNREEINLIERGGNYGWSVREGSSCYPPEQQQCQRQNLIDPFFEYDHADGCAVIGGFVYRGEAIAALQGQYVFGDFCSGEVWRLAGDAVGQPVKHSLIQGGFLLSAFAEDQAGELYVLNWEEGAIFRLRAQRTTTESAFPQLLSATGCVDPADPSQPAAGLIPYQVNAPFWSDGAAKQRWLALPEATTIQIDSAGDWLFPPGAVLMKNFELSGELIETRLLVRHQDGGWGGYSYAWREDGSDADYVPGGGVWQRQGQGWIYPSSSQCLRCHTTASKIVLGPETAQLNGDLHYPDSGITANQLLTLDHIGLFAQPLGGQAEDYPVLADPADPMASLEQRARAYLHSNCSQCHQPAGPTRLGMDLRYTTALADTGICDEPPQTSALGIENARIVAPGAPERSVLLSRINRRDLYRMPPVGSNQVDSAGVALVDAWIAQLTDCQSF
ncbi:MAG: PQQ-dependent sugar dehydrogenase [Gammaproteobacteria bacterium]